jgi:hypothetical protein
MPRLDGTGPQGQGPRTGRGLGNCQGNGKNQTKEEQKKSLLDEKERIEKELSDLEKDQ